MNNPFGKIIQNGVEYNVSQYANKIVVTGNESETHKSVLNRLYNALKVKEPNLINITHAELHCKNDLNSKAVSIYHLSAIDPDGTGGLKFSNTESIGSGFKCTTIDVNNDSSLTETRLYESNGQPQIRFTDDTNFNMMPNEEFVLYYT